MSTLFAILCFRVTTIHLNVNQASVETEARGVPPNQVTKRSMITTQVELFLLLAFVHQTAILIIFMQ